MPTCGLVSEKLLVMLEKELIAGSL
jgi:hypothetical protein